MDNKQALKEISKCKSIDEIISLAEKHNYKISKDKAQELFNKTHTNDRLSDDELNNVSGGGCGGYTSQQSTKPDTYDLFSFKSQEAVTFILNIGDSIKFCKWYGFSYYIYDAVIIAKKAMTGLDNNQKKAWLDCYDVQYEQNGFKVDEYNLRRDVILKK